MSSNIKYELDEKGYITVDFDYPENEKERIETAKKILEVFLLMKANIEEVNAIIRS